MLKRKIYQLVYVLVKAAVLVQERPDTDISPFLFFQEPDESLAMERKRPAADDTKEAAEKRRRSDPPPRDEAAANSDESSSPSSEPIIKTYPANEEQFTTRTPDTDETPPSSCETAGKSSGHRDSDLPADWDDTPSFMLTGSSRTSSSTSTASTSQLLSRQDPPRSHTPPSSSPGQLERGRAVTSPSQLGHGWSLLTQQPPSGGEDLLRLGASASPVQDLPSDSEERFSTPPEQPPSPSEQADAQETAFLRDMGKYNQEPPM